MNAFQTDHFADSRRTAFLFLPLLVILLSAILAPSSVASMEGKGAVETVEGTVVDKGGNAVSGAQVSLVIDQRVPKLMREVAAAAQGKFTLEYPEPEGDDQYRIKILVEAPGYARMPADLRGGKSGPLTVTMQPATDLQVIFQDQAGAPVAGVKVMPEMLVMLSPTLRYLDLPGALRERLAETTDAQGHCRFAAWPSGSILHLGIADERYARLSIHDFPQIHAGLGGFPVVKLFPAATVRGVATYGPSHQPAAGVMVGAQGIDDSNWSSAVTDALGRYELKQMRPGPVNIGLEFDGASAEAWTAAAHEKVKLAAGEHRENVDFTLIRGSVITGIVSAEDNGAPLADLSVGVYGPARPRSGAWVQVAKTDHEGRYTLRVPPGTQYLYLQSRPPRGFGGPTEASRNLKVKDGETATVDFELPRASVSPAPRLRVVDAAGNPVAGAEVFLGFGENSLWDSARSDREGNVHLDDSKPSWPQKARAQSGKQSTRETVSLAPGEETVLRLE